MTECQAANPCSVHLNSSGNPAQECTICSEIGVHNTPKSSVQLGPKSTVFVVAEKGIDEHKALAKTDLSNLPGSANDYVRVVDYINQTNRPAKTAPEFIPEGIKKAFDEGATCLSISCFNAAGTMFRLCVDQATTRLLPEEDVDGLNARIRRSLGLRLAWLFDNQRLPEALRDLSHCIKEDGNDGAHAGTLEQPDAEDLLDFTIALLERLFTEPQRIQQARERRDARRNPGMNSGNSVQ